jgi:uncharacterized delta-60 repeat protein
MNRCAKQLIVCAFLVFVCFIIASPGYGQRVTTYGGLGNDGAKATQQTQDGGYIVAGETSSFGAGSSDIWILKLTSTGTITWQRTYGGTGADNVRSIQQTTDGGYIVAGYTSSFGAGSSDIWILKLTSTGTITWQRTYGGTGMDLGQSIQQTTDGGYIVAGWTNSFGNGGVDYWVLKLTSTGGISWEKTYGGPDLEAAYDIRQTTDGGYIIVGEKGLSAPETWILKLTSTGDVSWQKAYSGGADASSVQQTADGGYIVNGQTHSSGDYDAWILKLTSTGEISWQKTYGGRGNGVDPLSGYEFFTSVKQTADGGYIMAGYTNSWGAGDRDVWIMKLTSTGNVSWEKTYGGPGLDRAESIQQTQDGGYIVVGETSSFGAGGSDMWILRLEGNGNVEGCAVQGISAAIVADTATVPVASGITPANSTAANANTSATVTITTVSEALICEASSQYELSVDRIGSGAGTVASSPPGISCGLDCTEAYSQGQVVTLTATEDGGSAFSGWSDCDSANGNTCTMTMTTSKSVFATFTLDTSHYTLTATQTGTGTGAITASGLTCTGSSCTGSYTPGTAVTLTATAEYASTFTSWTGCDSVINNICTVTMNTNKAVSATFTVNTMPAQNYYLMTQWGSSGIGDGQFNNPKGVMYYFYLNNVAQTLDQSIYVTDSGNNRIQKFSTGGTYIMGYSRHRGRSV